MFARFSELDRSFDVLDELRRQMDRAWVDDGGRPSATGRMLPTPTTSQFPPLSVHDAGAELVVVADVPGMTEKDIEVTLHDGVLSLRGERVRDVPEGMVVHRLERGGRGQGGRAFRRSLALPVRVDAEKTTATVRDGQLTVKMPKLVDAGPRKIAVRS